MPHSVKKTYEKHRANLTQEQVKFIKNQTLPSVLEITQASEFDTPFVQTKSDRWEYVRLGRPYTNIFDLDEHGNKLLKILSVMVLGQTTTVAAQYYIMSTPELALLKHKSLGQNPVWKDMMGLLLTGYLIGESEWSGKTVSGMLKGKLILRIGGCSRKQDKCHLAKVRSCYGCFYFRPFNCLSKHQTVLEVITNELLELVKTSHDAGNRNNPLVDSATQTKNEIEMVINRLKGGLR
ncbi:TPA: hypothetical protein N3C02_003572 [Vibrio parahaemolyticus]|nr:hypothetical protein [Vibrio parahaemolyticus]HAS6726104.1 hypothetical protein [Vibrio parahaemolyticus]HAS6784348.1 hypothetical protein [Vibrio parahaemolyticus]HAS6792129.1 hypothetical protein [Vibrio parahaemolyticus]HAS6897156.1 hypothetical protein [Vibrio parahaemolyticus]